MKWRHRFWSVPAPVSSTDKPKTRTIESKMLSRSVVAAFGGDDGRLGAGSEAGHVALRDFQQFAAMLNRNSDFLGSHDGNDRLLYTRSGFDWHWVLGERQ